MYRSLLVPLDGSAFGEQALPAALSIARRAGAALRVVHVHVPYTLTYGDSLAPFADAVEERTLRSEHGYLDELTQKLASATSLPVTFALIEGTAVAEKLEADAAANQIELIVMTTHGRGPMSRLWLGSVADELVRRSSTPILMIRPGNQSLDLSQETAFQHILVPLDGSDCAEQALEQAIALGSLMQSQYTLVRVVGVLVPLRPDPLSYAAVGAIQPSLEERRAQAEAYLQQKAGALRQRGLTVETQTIIDHQPALAILNAAQVLNADLIAMTTHGYRGLTRLLLGSVADKVLRGASTPVLLQRPVAR
jgi:nucleotide-binding universal stress UspA family protein